MVDELLNTSPPLPAKTTRQEDLTTSGQRRINLIWEFTQAVIALAVVMANLIVAVNFGLTSKAAQEFPSVLSSSLFLVIGFYFSRTNHQSIGGVGYKPDQNQEYVGR